MVTMFMNPRSTLAAIVVILLLVWTGCGGNERRTEEEQANTADVIEAAADTTVIPLQTESTPGQDAEELTVEELFYDDGTIDQRNSPWSEQAGGQLAVCFTPRSYPVTVRRVRFFVGGNGIPMKAFRVRLYPGDGSTGPVERDLLDAEIVAAASYGNQWVEIDLSAHGIAIPEGDFFVAMEWITAPGDYGTRAQLLGADTSDPSRRSWWKHRPDSDWVRIEEISDTGDRDLMIRARVAEIR
jgi:hypothetical protein